jgi:hypothetical protein
MHRLRQPFGTTGIMRGATWPIAFALCAWLVLMQAAADLQPVRSTTGFASEIASLSEPEGTFDTDNLISNESSYLQVVPALISQGISGGVYIGVGPDQNFSYIARIKPAVAYIIDIRRDNLLLHLLFKALFARSTTRAEYLSLLTGRLPPPDPGRWRDASIGQITALVDGNKPAPAHDGITKQLRRTITEFGVPLSAGDLDTIDRFHRRFAASGLDLRFQTHGRPPRPYYPTFRDLLLATDSAGTAWNYLAQEDAFQFVKSLQARNRIIPVVGDVAGEHAMRAIAAAIARQRRTVSAFYVSNVETYIYRDERATRFVENMRRLPHDDRSVLIRSLFSMDGASTSVLAPFSTLPR